MRVGECKRFSLHSHFTFYFCLFSIPSPSLCCHSATLKHCSSLSNPGLQPFCFLDHSWPRVGTHCLWATSDLPGPGTCSPPPSRRFEREMRRRLERKELESQLLIICEGCDSASCMLQQQQLQKLLFACNAKCKQATSSSSKTLLNLMLPMDNEKGYKWNVCWRMKDKTEQAKESFKAEARRPF